MIDNVFLGLKTDNFTSFHYTMHFHGPYSCLTPGVQYLDISRRFPGSLFSHSAHFSSLYAVPTLRVKEVLSSEFGVKESKFGEFKLCPSPRTSKTPHSEPGYHHRHICSPKSSQQVSKGDLVTCRLSLTALTLDLSSSLTARLSFSKSTSQSFAKFHHCAVHEFRRKRATGCAEFAHLHSAVDAIVRQHICKITPRDNRTISTQGCKSPG